MYFKYYLIDNNAYYYLKLPPFRGLIELNINNNQIISNINNLVIKYDNLIYKIFNKTRKRIIEELLFHYEYNNLLEIALHYYSYKVSLPNNTVPILYWFIIKYNIDNETEYKYNFGFAMEEMVPFNIDEFKNRRDDILKLRKVNESYGILETDTKWANLYIDNTNKIYLSDFGEAGISSTLLEKYKKCTIYDLYKDTNQTHNIESD